MGKGCNFELVPRCHMSHDERHCLTFLTVKKYLLKPYLQFSTTVQSGNFTMTSIYGASLGTRS